MCLETKLRQFGWEMTKMSVSNLTFSKIVPSPQKKTDLVLQQVNIFQNEVLQLPNLSKFAMVNLIEY